MPDRPLAGMTDEQLLDAIADLVNTSEAEPYERIEAELRDRLTERAKDDGPRRIADSIDLSADEGRELLAAANALAVLAKHGEPTPARLTTRVLDLAAVAAFAASEREPAGPDPREVLARLPGVIDEPGWCPLKCGGGDGRHYPGCYLAALPGAKPPLDDAEPDRG